MFYYLDGTAAILEPGLAVIECGGVGYACRTTLTTTAQLKAGQRVRLYTYLYIKEDAVDLYGFASQEELSCFKQLIAISGVGPRVAQGLLSVIPPQELTLAVMADDVKALTAAPGVGKKLAQRVIMELKDKLSSGNLEFSGGGSGAAPEVFSANGKMAEASAALQALGYTPSEALSALKGLDPEALSVENMIRLALKGLAQR